MKFIFWLSIIWTVYTYFGYLVILIIISKFNKKPKIIKDKDFIPSVSLIAAAHNEEKVIRRKIEESLNLDYPKEKLEIIIASDGSTDRTDQIVNDFAGRGVVLVQQDKHRGKTAVQNLAVLKARGEILVFSDATTIFKEDALKKLVRNFKDPIVGCVGGEEHFLKSQETISKEASFYWRYERFLRRKESDFNTLIGVSGCIFAIRRRFYEPLEDSLGEDFTLPLKVASKGFRVVYEKEAIGYEEAAMDTKTELARKTRIVSRGINALFKMRHLLNPFKYPSLSFQLISHKIFRWFAPIFMLSLFFSSLFLLGVNRFFFVMGMCQVIFYILATVGFFLKNHKYSPKFVRLIYHFCIVNIAGIWGMINFLKGERKVIWQPIR